MPPKQPAQTREKLLDAAVNTLRAHGSLTLDAVAREAGVSKGGLLHHFPSKESLADALLRDLMHEFDEAVTALVADEPDKPGRWLRAYVRATFEADDLPLELATVLFTAFSQHDSLTGIIQEDAARWHARLTSDGIPPARATIIRMAADAYWTDRLLGLAPSGLDRESLLAELILLTELS